MEKILDFDYYNSQNDFYEFFLYQNYELLKEIQEKYKN